MKRECPASPRRLLDGVALSCRLAALAALTIFSGAPAGESGRGIGDWPQFLGPGRDATSAEKGLIETWPKDGPPLLWSKRVGTGYSAPSVLGEHLVLHHRQGDEEIVECLEPSSGRSLWRHAYPSQFTDPYGYNNGPRCTPVLTTNRCYTFGAEGRLVCVDLATGRLVWERETAKDWSVPAAFFGVGSSPVLDQGRLIVMVGGQPDSGVVAFDPETGKTLWESVGEKNWRGQPMIGWPGDRTVVWKRTDKQASYATPVTARIHGLDHLFCLTRQGLVSLDPEDGRVRFSRWFRAQIEESVNAANPVVVDDLVFFSAAYYRVGSVVIRVLPGDRGFEEVWKDRVLEIHWSTPVYHDGHLYAFSGRNEPDARFRCVEFSTGKLKWDRDESWAYRSTPTPPVYGRGSAILADGKLVALGEGGLLGMFRASPREPEELARWQVPQLRYPCWTGPVLARKHLFLRNEEWLLCLDFAR